MKTLFSYFIRGLFYTAPLGITIYLVIASMSFLDHLIPLDIPGAGLLVMIIIITFIGYLGSVILASSVGNLVRQLEKFVVRIPGVKLIYTALKDVISALMGSKRSFEQAVIVVVDKANEIEKIGFVTKNDLSPLGLGSDRVSVYFPYSYGIMGDLRIVPRSSNRPIPGKPAEIIKFII